MGIWERFRDRRAVAFVDYEHWFFSLKTDYATKPDVQAWAKEVREQYKVERMLFFANFAQAVLHNEITRIRAVTNDIIEIQFGLPGSHMKDMSDFVMLDHIYRAATAKHSPKTFLLFTGDGHFAPVVRFLVQDLEKNVVVYGIRGSVSQFLKDAASECWEFPDEEAQMRIYWQHIVDYFDEMAERRPNMLLTFGRVVNEVSSRQNIPLQSVEAAFSQMLQQMDAPLGSDALSGFRTLLPKSLLQTQLFRLLWVLGSAAQTAAGAAGAVFTPVPGRSDKPAVFFFCVFPTQRKLSALGAGKAVFFRIISHVLYPTDLLLKLFAFLLVVIRGLDQASLAGRIQVEVVVQALIPSIRHYFLISSLLELLQPPQERSEGSDVIPVRKCLDTSDILTVHRDLYIVPRLELPIAHVILLHPHEGGILICLGVAVAAFPHRGQLCFISFPAFQQPRQAFPVLLFQAFPLPLAVDKADFLSQTLQMGLQSGWGGQARRLTHLLLHLCQVLFHAFPPHKGIPSSAALQFGAVYKDCTMVCLTHSLQSLNQLVEQPLQRLTAPSRPEPGQRAVVRRFLIPKQPHEVHTVPAGLLQLAAGIDPAQVSVHYKR